MSSTAISELLRISPRFLRSVNLERDFLDAKALEGYVATQETERHLKRIGTALRPESGQRAWRITGDFGSGKSSFALVLANLLGRSSKELPPSIRKLRENLGLRSNTPKLLPVLITGSREPISQALLRGLQDTLFRSIDGRKKLRISDKISEALELGGLEDRFVISLIEEACQEIVEKELSGGLLLIIDELGKFLEYSSLHPERQDAFFLQTLAESSSRSRNHPLYTLGLLHQGFAEYAERLPSTVQREWAKIAERFEEVPFSQPLGQVATLLAAALSAKIEHESLRGWKSRANEDMRNAIEFGMFGPSAPKTALANIAPELYPLHPTVVPVLARFFRRFGQNERSLFSFLLSSEPFALQDFATRAASADAIYRLADFYDFAVFNFAHQLTGQSFRSHWTHIDAVIRSADGEPAAVLALLKTVGILNVIESPELRPTQDVLALATGAAGDLGEQLQLLCQRNILFNRGTAGYALWPYTSVNLEQRFEAAREALPHASPIAYVVRDRLDARPIVARRHYIQTGNLRHFEVRFLGAESFKPAHSSLSKSHQADGVVAVVLCESAAERNAAEQIAASYGEEKGLVVAISPPLDSLAGSALELERWLWVERHTPELKDDRFAGEEVQRQVTTSRQILENRIQDYVGFRTGDAADATRGIAWLHAGKNVGELVVDGTLQTFLSNLCDDLFHEAPRILNELVNRHSISAAAASARQKLFKVMLERGADPELGMPMDKAPPEKSIYLSVLREGRIHRKEKDGWTIGLPKNAAEGDPLQLKPALDAVVAHLEQVPDRRIQVSELYALLRSAPYGVRDGLIPILLLVVFIVHEPEIAVYEDNVFQPEIEEFLLSRFAKRPETFEFQLCKITGVRKALIRELAAVVESDRAETSQLLSIVRPLYLFVAGLPEYARNTDKLSSESLALRRAIEAAREPVELVYHEIPKALGFKNEPKTKPDAEQLAKVLAKSIGELRRCFPELQDRMATAILEAFGFEESLDDWREAISESAETILVGLGDPDFRAFCLKLIDTGNTEAEWLEALGSLLTSCPPSRWKDRDELVFRERIYALGAQFNRVLATYFDKHGELPDTAIRLAVTPRTGLERNLVFNLSPKQAKDVEKLASMLRANLPSNDQISLAALSRLLWDILPNDV